jgi:hypothetical protein
MIRFLLPVFLIFSFITVGATEIACKDVKLNQAFQAISMKGEVACFFYKKDSSQLENGFENDPYGVSVYSVRGAESSSFMYELPYAGTAGKINDVFRLFVNGSNDERIFVIHSFEAPGSWDVVGDVYNVSVIKHHNGALVHDTKLSRFFDLGGDVFDSNGRPIYIYPYKDRSSVEKAILTPIFQVINSSAVVEGVINQKTFLYAGDSEPSMHDSSKAYLIEGDRVTVTDSMAGWCKISYPVKEGPAFKWVQCGAITFKKLT